MTPEDIAEMQRHEAEVAEAFRKLEETADAAKRGWAKAATEVERLTVELACMTAERDGYRDQLSADWQAQQISDLMAAAGRAREERDEALAALDRVRALANKLASLAPEDDWGDDMPSTVGADVGRQFLAALDGSST